jgi:hypothetical protein
VVARSDAKWVTKASFVDYNWEIANDIRTVYAVGSDVGMFLGGTVDVIGTQASSRGTQTGVRVEGGVRLAGSQAAVELYVAGERRIDPYPLEFDTASWLSMGFRFVSR